MADRRGHQPRGISYSRLAALVDWAVLATPHPRIGVPMNEAGSVTLYLRRLKEGDQKGFQKLWEGYFARLVGLARKRLQGVPRQAEDEEDVALSAFNSFHKGVGLGRFPQLLDRHDLW